MSTSSNGSLSKLSETDTLPKRPDIPRTSGNFFQSLPMPQQLSHYNMPQSFLDFKEKPNHNMGLLPVPGSSMIPGLPMAPFAPFSVPSEAPHLYAPPHIHNHQQQQAQMQAPQQELRKHQMMPPPNIPFTAHHDTKQNELSTYDHIVKPESADFVPVSTAVPTANYHELSTVPHNTNDAPGTKSANVFKYPQDIQQAELPTLKSKSVSVDFDEVRTYNIETIDKGTDPLAFIGDHYKINDSALKISTSSEWASRYAGRIPKSLWVSARRQYLNPGDKPQNSEANIKMAVFENRVLDFARLKILVRINGGVEKVNSSGLWFEIGKELGYVTDASEFLRSQYEKASKSTPLPEFANYELNSNGKRAALAEGQKQFDKRLRADTFTQPIIKASAYEYRRSRKASLAKGFSSYFDRTTTQKSGITNDEGSVFEEWVSRKKDVLDSSIYNDASYYRLSEFQELSRVTEKSVGITDLSSVEDIEAIFWKYLESGQTLEVLSAPRVFNKQHIFPVATDEHPWNLYTLSRNSRSLFKYLSNPSSVVPTPSVSVGMLFSTENWTMEDHALPLLDYNHYGAEKIWYFISAQNSYEFENLIEKQNDNYGAPAFNTRAEHADPFFARYANTNKLKKFNAEIAFSPEFLKANGIAVTKVVQRPGDFILKFPGVYSFSVSLGVTVSESINFAPPLWLDFALDAEWSLARQGILSNLSTFDMLIEISKNCKDPHLIAVARDISLRLCEEEIQLRERFRELLPEASEKVNKNYDFYVTEDDLSNSIPSVVVLISKSDHQFSMSLRNFLVQYQKDKSKFDQSVVYFKLLLYYEDEKLKALVKNLSRDIMTSKSWSSKLEASLKEESKPSFRLLKQLYSEGEKLFTEEYLLTVYSEETDAEHYQRFLQLGEMIEEFSSWIELAQRYLSSKHVSRKRKGKKDEEEAFEEINTDLNLAQLCQMIEEIPSLSFYTEEMDQLINLSMEIEDYEMSARKAISSVEELTLEELYNILNLGKSFGIEIPSVNFLQEYEKTTSWLSKFKESQDLGLIATFKDMESMGEFLGLGKSIKSIRESHFDKLVKLESLYSKTNDVNDLGNRIINKSQKAFEIEEVDSVLQGSYEYPIDPEIRNDLLKIRSEYDEVAQKSSRYIEMIEEAAMEQEFLSFEALDALPKFQQIKTLLDKAHSLKIRVPDVKILEENYYKKAEDWLRAVRRILHRQNSSSSNLRNYLTTLAAGVKVSIGNKADHVLVGSEEEPSSNENIYCICRAGESGLMVECERCSEWYHLGCFNLNKIKMKNKSFVCPICDENGEHKELYENMKIQYRPDTNEIISVVHSSVGMKYLPSDEFQDLKEIFDAIMQFKSILKENLQWSETGVLEDSNIHKIRFYLRKLTGSQVDFKEETHLLSQHLKFLLDKEEKKAQMDLAAAAIQQVNGSQTEEISEKSDIPSSPPNLRDADHIDAVEELEPPKVRAEDVSQDVPPEVIKSVTSDLLPVNEANRPETTANQQNATVEEKTDHVIDHEPEKVQEPLNTILSVASKVENE